MKRFAAGNTPVSIFAIGNVSVGVVAIGGTVSIGVVSIGMNAVGVVAIGLNAVGPIAISAINAIGIFVIAGVNALGGGGHGYINNGTLFGLGAVLAVAFVVAGEVLARKRPPREVEPAVATTPLASLDTIDEGVYAVRGTPRGTSLEAGGHAIRTELQPEWEGREGVFSVRVTDTFDDGAGYRDAPQRERRFAVVDATFETPRPWLASIGDLAWLIGRSLQIASVGALLGAYLS